MANDEHIVQIKEGVASWNAWRHDNLDIHPDLREADLNGQISARRTSAGQSLAGMDLGQARAKLPQRSGREVPLRILRSHTGDDELESHPAGGLRLGDLPSATYSADHSAADAGVGGVAEGGAIAATF